MENARWKKQLLEAHDVRENYQLEKEIRKASENRELYCPDLDCQSPILRYCHGEIKEAYFAHLYNNHCDYATFDSAVTETMRTVRWSLYNLLKKQGYNVRQEVKVLPHHYTHLFIEMIDGSMIAIEIGTQQFSANQIDDLVEEYCNNDISVKWIVIGNPETIVQENKTYFIKRYLLNESTNKDLLVVSHDGKDVTQYKADLTKYEFNGHSVSITNYPRTYSESARVGRLTLTDGELTLPGFNKRYEKWFKKKQIEFNKKIKLLSLIYHY